MATYEDAVAAKIKLARAWIRHPEVSALGIGGEDGNYVVRVFFEKKAPDDLPPAINGIQVVTIPTAIFDMF